MIRENWENKSEKDASFFSARFRWKRAYPICPAPPIITTIKPQISKSTQGRSMLRIGNTCVSTFFTSGRACITFCSSDIPFGAVSAISAPIRDAANPVPIASFQFPRSVSRAICLNSDALLMLSPPFFLKSLYHFSILTVNISLQTVNNL